MAITEELYVEARRLTGCELRYGLEPVSDTDTDLFFDGVHDGVRIKKEVVPTHVRAFSFYGMDGQKIKTISCYPERVRAILQLYGRTQRSIREIDLQAGMLPATPLKVRLLERLAIEHDVLHRYCPMGQDLVARDLRAKAAEVASHLEPSCRPFKASRGDGAPASRYLRESDKAWNRGVAWAIALMEREWGDGERLLHESGIPLGDWESSEVDPYDLEPIRKIFAAKGGRNDQGEIK